MAGTQCILQRNNTSSLFKRTAYTATFCPLVAEMVTTRRRHQCRLFNNTQTHAGNHIQVRDGLKKVVGKEATVGACRFGCSRPCSGSQQSRGILTFQ